MKVLFALFEKVRVNNVRRVFGNSDNYRRSRFFSFLVFGMRGRRYIPVSDK